jgi:hypothetical protein
MIGPARFVPKTVCRDLHRRHTAKGAAGAPG